MSTTLGGAINNNRGKRDMEREGRGKKTNEDRGRADKS